MSTSALEMHVCMWMVEVRISNPAEGFNDGNYGRERCLIPPPHKTDGLNPHHGTGRASNNRSSSEAHHYPVGLHRAHFLGVDLMKAGPCSTPFKPFWGVPPGGIGG